MRPEEPHPGGDGKAAKPSSRLPPECPGEKLCSCPPHALPEGNPRVSLTERSSNANTDRCTLVTRIAQRAGKGGVPSAAVGPRLPACVIPQGIPNGMLAKQEESPSLKGTVAAPPAQALHRATCCRIVCGVLVDQEARAHAAVSRGQYRTAGPDPGPRGSSSPRLQLPWPGRSALLSRGEISGLRASKLQFQSLPCQPLALTSRESPVVSGPQCSPATAESRAQQGH